MTPHEKAVNALNRRLEGLQANLRDVSQEAARPFLFQSLVGTLAVGEALSDYIREVGAYARRRHAELKRANDALTARHAELLKSGNTLLEQLKANPGDRTLRKEVELARDHMASVQKNLRRAANALQREVAPGVAVIDRLADSVKRLAEADGVPALQRVIKTAVELVRELYATQPEMPSRTIIDADAWSDSANAGIEQAAGLHDAYARASYQAVLVLELTAMAVSENPPATAGEATARGAQAVGRRLQQITARFTGDAGAQSPQPDPQ